MLAAQNNLLIRQSWVIVYQGKKEHHVDGAPREGHGITVWGWWTQ